MKLPPTIYDAKHNLSDCVDKLKASKKDIDDMQVKKFLTDLIDELELCDSSLVILTTHSEEL